MRTAPTVRKEPLPLAMSLVHAILAVSWTDGIGNLWLFGGMGGTAVEAPGS